MRLQNKILTLLLFIAPMFAYSQTVSSVELMTNGDFENGLSGYSTGYKPFQKDVCERGSYAFCTNPITVYYKYHSMPDNTTGHSNMMFFDSDTLAGTLLLKTTISGLSINTNYMFSFYSRNNNLYVNFSAWHPKLKVTLNGVDNPDIIDCYDTTKWIKHEIKWNSGDATELTVEFSNIELAINQFGNKSGVSNDFALDDISLRKICDLGIDMTDKVQICEGDSATFDVLLTGSAQSESFEWKKDNTMDTSIPTHPRVFPKTSRYYYLDVFEVGGCEIIDSVLVEVHKKPVPKLVFNGATVICPCKTLSVLASAGDDSYPFTYLWNDNITTPQRNISEPGYYSLTVSNQLGCSKTIDTIITGVSPNVSVSPSELTVSTGDTFNLPLNMSINNGILDCGYTNFKIKLSYLKSLLVPIINNGLSISSADGTEYLVYEGPVIADFDNMFKFIATLGTAKCTDVKVEELNFNCNEINFDVKNGKVCLDNVCSEPTDRFFTETNYEVLGQNYPNPSNGITEIKFSLSSPGFTKLIIYDALGNVIDTPVSGQLKAEDYDIKVNTAKLNAGVYIYVLKTEYDSYSKIMQVVK